MQKSTVARALIEIERSLVDEARLLDKTGSDEQAASHQKDRGCNSSQIVLRADDGQSRAM